MTNTNQKSGRPLKIGIIREWKVPPDNRTPLTPRQCCELMEENEAMEIVAEYSPVRCYANEEYEKFEVEVTDNIAACDLLVGIKEVPPDKLVPVKTYMFFSHTIKKQPHNRKLLKAAIDKGITLIDHELLTDDKGHRIIGFGRWAGIVGAHYALMMLGERTGGYKLKPAKECINLQELVDQYELVQFPPVKFAITGGGRVASGAIEIMQKAKIRRVSIEEYLHETFEEPVYVQLHSEDIYKAKDGTAFDKKLFYESPEQFDSNFERFIGVTDVLINCMFWDPLAPRLFEKEDTKDKAFRIKTIADVSCDIDGSVPLTARATSIEDPIFGYRCHEGKESIPYKTGTIDLMAVPNLPNELPRDASRDFGAVLMEAVVPRYLEDPHGPLFERATIVKAGQLMPEFEYLRDYAEGK